MPTEQKTYELQVKPREAAGKGSKKLRRESVLPGVVYGFGVDPTPVEVDQKEMERVYLRAGSNGLVDLKIGDGAQARKVFIHNVQRNPVTQRLTHIDFMAVNLRQEMTSTVALVLTGESPAVAAKEGRLIQALDHLQVRALPSNLPPLIEVDLTPLDEVDKAIHVSDLTIPENVTVLTSEEEMIVKITALAAEEVVEVEEAEEAEEGAEAEEGEAEGGDAEAQPAGEAES